LMSSIKLRVMNESNKIVHGLWIGNTLSIIEQLCIRSYISCGHSFYLWLYEPLQGELPPEVHVKNASEIIPREQVFCYRNTNQFGHGKGSFAGFSDIFRYKLLYEKGGWWTDMDVVCLKPLDFDAAYVFRNHHDFPVIGNIMKCPQGSELMKACFDEATQQVTDENTDWNLPIKILNKHIALKHLENHILPFTNCDDWRIVKQLIIKNIAVPMHWHAIHLLNEEWRRHGIRKNGIAPHSYLGRKFSRYMPQTKPEFRFVRYLQNIWIISKPGEKLLAIKNRIIRFMWNMNDIFWKWVRGIQRNVFGIYK